MLLTTIALALFVAKPDAAVAAAPRPLEYDRPIVQADLEGRTLRELALMRNSIFARAHQVFRKRWLADYFGAQSWYQPSGFEKKLVSKLGRQNADKIAEYELKLPKAELTRRYDALMAVGFKYDETDKFEDLLEAHLLGIATGREMKDFALYPVQENHRDPLYDVDLLNEPLSVQDLSNYSRRDLRILRNTVFARRGRPFKTESMQKWFARMDWYTADPKYTEKRLTRVDLENIKLIRSVEETQGGPQTESEAQAQGLEDFSGA